jgi:hypothetical protein
MEILCCFNYFSCLDSILRNNKDYSQLNLLFSSEINSVSGDFVDFQLHFRTFAVIGLVSASEISRGIESLLVKYNSVLERFPYPVCARIFVIDCEERISSLTAPFVSIPMNDISGTLDVQFASIGSEIVSGMINLLDSLSARPSLPSPCGIEDFSGTASRPATRTKMKISSRLQKLTADLHILTGKFSEAVACYAMAAEDAKSVNDLVWQTGALEGFQIAICLQNEVSVFHWWINFHKYYFSPCQILLIQFRIERLLKSCFLWLFNTKSLAFRCFLFNFN